MAIEAFEELTGVVSDDEHDVVASEIARAGGAAAAIDLMKRYPEDLLVQGYGCMILRLIANISDCLKREICDQGGITRVIFAIKTYTYDEYTLHHGLGALYLMAEDALSSNVAEICAEIPLVLKAIGTYTEDNDTQMITCNLLRELARSSSTNCEALVNAGCIPILIASLQRMLEETPCQELPNQSVLNLNTTILLIFILLLSSVDELSFEFAEAAGFQTTLDTMRRYKDEKIQALTCAVISKMNHSQQHERAAICDAGGIEHIIDAMKLYMRLATTSDQDFAEELKFTVLALGILAKDNRAAITAIHRAGGVAMLFEILQEPFPSVEFANKNTLHGATISLLISLAASSFIISDTDEDLALLSEMIDCGAIPTILLSMEQYPNEAMMQTMGFTLLLALAPEAQEGAISIVVDGGRKII